MTMKVTYESLKEITENFSDKIGSGTFGDVYKGKGKDGQEIAVKVLHDQSRDLDGIAFTKEFDNLSKLNHPNIIRLVGFCDDEEPELIVRGQRTFMATKIHRALCFEYLRNGSLQNHLSDEHQGFDWQTRYVIIKGICTGLKYLHTGLKEPVQHLDLKPSNILLCDNMVPKIADFGISRLRLGEETSKKTMSMLGTLGYCPPEFIGQQIISTEFDIFSLGVIIIRIICGPAAHSPGDDKTETREFISQVQKKWRERLGAIPGHTPRDVDYQCRQVKKCIEIALNCTIKDRKRRPDIESIVDQLAETADEVISTDTFGKMVSMDVHPTEPWIVTGHFNGHVCLWNYETKEMVKSFELTRGMEVLTVKFLARKQWIVAGGGDGHIYVYCYNTMMRVKSFSALSNQITSLAIHPTEPYVLSASYDFVIKMWDWENGWISTWEFADAHSGSVMQIAFSPNDVKAFASVSKDNTIKIWSVDSAHANFTLAGHTSYVRCLDYFTRGDRQYLITGSDDHTAKIWDLQSKICVETLEGHENRVSTVCSHPELPILMTGSRDGTVRLWNSNSFRLEDELNFGLGKVHALECTKDSRVVIGHSNGLAITEIGHHGCW